MVSLNFEESEWIAAKRKFEVIFGEDIEINGILYLIGVQELGKGICNFDKDDKMNLMHIAVCRLLEPFGHYTFLYRDKEGWPHYTKTGSLPTLSQKEQENLLKMAIIRYSDTELP